MLMTHLYYGDPNKEFSMKLAKTLIEVGADILEVGIPYTDPVCDGEVFQRACKRALAAGVTPLDVLGGVKKIRQIEITKPIYLTSYYGPIFKIGVETFVRKAKEVGVTGLIIPDILLGEQQEVRKYSDRYGLSLIQFATVYSTKARLKQIIDASTDFIYCVSLPGVTGDGAEFISLEKFIKSITSLTDKNVFVGFGIQSTQDVKELIAMGADGVIVGSAIARIYEKNISQPEKSLSDISSFVKKLKESTII